MTRPAAAWNVQLGLPDGELPAVVQPGARVEVRVGADVAMTGSVDDVDDDVGGRTCLLYTSPEVGGKIDAPYPWLTAIQLDYRLAGRSNTDSPDATDVVAFKAD